MALTPADRAKLRRMMKEVPVSHRPGKKWDKAEVDHLLTLHRLKGETRGRKKRVAPIDPNDTIMS